MTLDTPPAPGPEDGAFHQLRGVWSYRWVVLAVTVLAAVAVVGLGRLGTPRYTSTAEVLVHTSSATPFDAGDPSKLLSMPTELQLAKSEKVAETVAQQAAPQSSPAELLAHLRVSSPPSTAVLQFAYDARSAGQAQQLADAFARAYLADREARTVAAVNRLTQVLTDEATALDQRRATLDEQISSATGSGARVALSAQRALAIDEQLTVRNKLVEARTVDTTPGDVVSPAAVPTVRSGPSLVSLVALGVLLGLAIGIAVAWLLAGLHGRRGGPDHGDRSPAVPVLITLPAQRDRRAGRSGAPARNSGAWQALLAARFGFGGAAGLNRVLMVVGVREQGPAAVTVVELANALAGGSRTVAVVEADLRHPSLLSVLEVDAADPVAASDKSWPWEPVSAPGLAGVTVFPAGVVEDPRGLLSGEDVATCLKNLREQFSHVLVLAPPVLVAVDALELLGSVDGVIIAASDTEPSADLAQVGTAIELGGGSLLGAVTVVARRGFASLRR